MKGDLAAAKEVTARKPRTMSQKHPHNPAPVPPGNRPHTGPATDEAPPEQDGGPTNAAQEQDPKRRLGNYEGAGEAPYRQPGGLNDSDH